MRKETFCLRVDREAFDYYNYNTTKPERDWVLSRMRATFKALVEELKRRKERGEAPGEEKREEITVKVEETLKVEESSVLRLYKKKEQLERELAKALASLEEVKAQLERERSERQRCAQELESMKRRPEELQKELAKRDAVARELLDLASLALYCLEAEGCDLAKLRDLLRTRLGKLGVEQAKPSEHLLLIVRKLPK